MPTNSICHVCGGSLREWLPEVTDPQTRKIFAIFHCGTCGLGHTVPPPDDLGSYYGPTYHGGRHGFTARWCARRRIRWVTSMCGPGRGRRLLDIGCGEGTFLLAAENKGWRTVGTEMNPDAARKAGLDVRTELDQAEEGVPYDCITLWHSLEHLRDPRSVLEGLSRLLNRRGLLIIAVPDAGGFQCKVFGRHWLHLDVPRHLYHFNRNSLVNLLDTQGFSVVREMHQEFEYDLLGWSQSVLNLCLPAPNVLFNKLTRRAQTAERKIVWAAFILGIPLSALSVPAVAVGAVCRRGGTLVIAASVRGCDDPSGGRIPIFLGKDHFSARTLSG